tara:strand:+ start:2104 stop:2475 length:372 start_codon:yes stop_codon:yes gene_type:complete
MLFYITYNSKYKKNSLQIGDHIFYVNISTSTLAGNFATDSPIYFGNLLGIDFNDDSGQYKLTVNCVITNFVPDPSTMFFLFGKNQNANESSLKGYYAEFKMVNNSSKRAELFSVGSEVTASSK